MTLAVEGAATAIFSSTATPAAINITTSGADRIVVVVVQNEKSTGAPTVSSVTAAGLTFALRKQYINLSGQNDLEVWWAYASAQQTAKAITVTLSGATDDSNIAVFAVSGVTNFAAPWDANPALPVVNSSLSASPATVPGVYTNNANCMVFGFWGNYANTTATVGSGYTSVATSHNAGGARFSNLLVEKQLFSSIQSNITVATAAANGADWGMIADAITSDANTGALTKLSGIGQALTGSPIDTGAITTNLSGIGQSLTTVLGAWTQLNPADKSSNITLSNGNLTATSSNTTAGGARAVDFQFNGKLYFEAASTTWTGSNTAAGIGSPSWGRSGANSANAVLAYPNGDIYINSVHFGATALLGAFVANDVMCFAVDLPNQLVWVRRNAGNWNGSATANPATGVGGFSYSGLFGGFVAPICSFNAVAAITFDFGDTAFAQTVPSGFTSGWPVVGSRDDAVVTQVGAEAWLSDPSNVNVTQVGVEAWVASTLITSALMATQVGVEVWQSTATAPTGTWASTEAQDIFFAAAGMTISGTWASTGVKDTFAAIGREFATGTWASVEAKDFIAHGPSLPRIGTWASVGAKDTMAFTGWVPITGTWASSSGTWASTGVKDTFAAIGHEFATGIWASVEAQDFTAHGPPPSGRWASVEAKDTVAFTGWMSITGTWDQISGTWASVEAKDTMAFTVIRGTWASVEAKDTMAFTGWVRGTWASVEAKDTMAFTVVRGTWASVEAKDTIAFTGWVLGFGFGGITGQIVAVDYKDHLSFNNYSTAVTGMLGATEYPDRWSSTGFLIPMVPPPIPIKRRLLILP
jgi:hypothetical protein